MRSEYILPFLWFIPIVIIQTTIIPLIAIQGYVPDLVIILLVVYTLKGGQLYGTVLGFLLGLLLDLISGNLIGSSMLSKTLAGFIAGYFANEGKLEFYIKSYPLALIVLLVASVDSVISSFFSGINFNPNIFKLFFEQGFVPAFYTAVVSVLVIFFYPRKKFI